MDDNNSTPRRRHTQVSRIAVADPNNSSGSNDPPGSSCKQQQKQTAPSPIHSHHHRDGSAFAAMSAMLLLLIGALVVGCTDPTVFDPKDNNNKVRMVTRQEGRDIPEWDDDFLSVQEPCAFTVLPCMTSRAPCCALFISEENVGLRLLGDSPSLLADQITQSLECSLDSTNYTNQTLASMCNANPSDPASRIPVQVSPLAGVE